MKTCRTCKHFQPPENPRAVWGTCTVLHGGNDGIEIYAYDELYQSVDVQIDIHPDRFGCIFHEEED